MMKTRALRNKLLSMFPLEAHGNIQPIVDTIIDSSKRDGILQGRQEAAAMIEMLVIGGDTIDIETLRGLMGTLRNEANTGKI